MQIIPDSLNTNYQNKALVGRLNDKGIIETSPQQLGVIYGTSKKAFQKLEQDYATTKAAIKKKSLM